MAQKCILHDLNLAPYGEVWRLQKDFVARMRDDEDEPERLILVEHPKVVTVGRRGNAAEELKITDEEYARRGFGVFHIDRGGKTTYHGPGQLVGYPIIRLARRKKDIHHYLRQIEEMLIALAREFDVDCARRQGLTGVWVGEEKLASIGVGIKRWITFHGFAFNVSTNLEDFRVIDPCGLGGVSMTSLEKLTGRNISMADVKNAAARIFSDIFGVDLTSAENAQRD